MTCGLASIGAWPAKDAPVWVASPAEPPRPAAAAMGSRGLAWVDREWRWDFVADRLRHILAV